MQCALYVHVPLCLRKCDYCDFFSVTPDKYPVTPENTPISRVITNTLCIEIQKKEEMLDIDGWSSVYIGGGTPSQLNAIDIRTLGLVINTKNTNDPSGFVEWTIEANPEDITEEWLSACSEIGINRLSLGIQSMKDTCLLSAGRRGSRTANLQCLSIVQNTWKGQLSIDLIAGLPLQDQKTLISDITEIIEYKPDHISLYSLTIEEGTPLFDRQNKISGDFIPDSDNSADLWISGRDFLENAGYKQYEVSNFAHPGFESKHNTTYWNLDSWAGVGAGASGTYRRGDTAIRTVNTKNISLWLSKDGDKTVETEIISRNECIRETMIMGFRLLNGISRTSFYNRFGIDIISLIPKTILSWEKNKLLYIDDCRIALNRDGLLFLNSFLLNCMEESCL